MATNRTTKERQQQRSRFNDDTLLRNQLYRIAYNET